MRFRQIITAAARAMFARHARIINIERDVIAPHKSPFVYYDEYLASPYWKARSAERMQAAGYTCQECGTTDCELNVHHLTYERLGEELDADLVVLCRECHKRKHGIDKP